MCDTGTASRVSLRRTAGLGSAGVRPALATCADCREEVDGLRGTRTHLTSWAPPEPDLGFQVVRERDAGRVAVAVVAASPAWGLAAAALLVVAASAAIANVEVEVRAATASSSAPDGAAAPRRRGPGARSRRWRVGRADLQRVEARLAELEGRLRSRRRPRRSGASGRRAGCPMPRSFASCARRSATASSGNSGELALGSCR